MRVKTVKDNSKVVSPEVDNEEARDRDELIKSLEELGFFICDIPKRRRRKRKEANNERNKSRTKTT